MARQIIVFALVFVAIVGFASAATSNTQTTVASAPVITDVIGIIGGHGAASPGAAVAGPLGSDSTHGSTAPAPGPSNGASSLQLSAFAGFAAAVAGSFFFF